MLSSPPSVPHTMLSSPSAVPHTMLSSSAVPHTMLSQSAPPQSVPHTMLSSPSEVPQTMLSSPSEVPQTMLSSSAVPQTMLSQSLAGGAPDDVVVVGGLRDAPVRADLEGVRRRQDEATVESVVAPDDSLAPHLLAWARGRPAAPSRRTSRGARRPACSGSRRPR